MNGFMDIYEEEASSLQLEFETKMQQVGGLVVVDITFKEPITDPFDLHFQNYYIHSLDVLVFDTEKEWKPMATDVVLMPSPHLEDGGQDYVMMKFHHDSSKYEFPQSRHDKMKLTMEEKLCCPEEVENIVFPIHIPKNLTLIRFVMYQPSPSWKSFGIRKMKCNKRNDAATSTTLDAKETMTVKAQEAKSAGSNDSDEQAHRNFNILVNVLNSMRASSSGLP
eukprot:m.38915 g.38915  ORF g.38915 m.38915 type:complete len:222 (-) comp6825_c0_seq1:1871-2536(-)